MPALAPALRPPEGSGVEAGTFVPGVVDDALVDVGADEAELEVGDGIPVVGNVRGVDVSEEVGVVDVVVVLAGTSDALKLSWYSGAKRT